MLQIAVFEHLRRRPAPGVFAWHAKNGGVHQASAPQRKLNAARGVVSGMPDVMIIRDAKPCRMIYGIELKTERGKLSADQADVLEELRRVGCRTYIAFGLDDALDYLEAEGLLIGARQ
jgi:hypothetical protein